MSPHGPPHLKPPHKQMSETPTQDWLFHLQAAQHLAWILSPKTISSPRCFQGFLWPLGSSKVQKDCGACGPGSLQPNPSVRPAWDPHNSLQVLLPRQLGGELASLCPSTQQLGHLLAPGDRAVHSEDSLLGAPANSPITHVTIKHLLSARSWSSH